MRWSMGWPLNGSTKRHAFQDFGNRSWTDYEHPSIGTFTSTRSSCRSFAASGLLFLKMQGWKMRLVCASSSSLLVGGVQLTMTLWTLWPLFVPDIVGRSDVIDNISVCVDQRWHWHVNVPSRLMQWVTHHTSFQIQTHKNVTHHTNKIMWKSLDTKE